MFGKDADVVRARARVLTSLATRTGAVLPPREGGACTVSKSKFGPGAYCGLFEGNEVDHSDRFPHLICRLQQRTTRPETRAEIQL